MLAAGASCPDHIAIIGGGRWARVLTDVLCGLVGPSVGVTVHSLHNADAMSAWAKGRGLGGRVRVSSEWPSTLEAAPGAAIVVNAARDHEQAAERLLDRGVPVLVEKPMALTSAGAERLANFARERNVRLASAHVFLFARYLDRFRQLVAEAGTVDWVRVEWTDPRHEQRYGESKHYDPTLPIAADLLPHVISLANDFAPNGPDRCERATIVGDGSGLELDLTLGSLPCHATLARDSDERRRVIEVGVEEVIRLDYSAEPGRISRGGVSMSGDLAWADGPRPVARMLTAFLQGAAGGEWDDRLEIGLGLRACRLIDQTLAWSGDGR